MVNALRELLATIFLLIGRRINMFCRAIALGLLTDAARKQRSERGYQTLTDRYPCSSSWNPEVLLEDVIEWRSRSVLDLGCGTGREAMIFARAGAIVTGIDSNEMMIGKAREEAKQMNLQVRFEVSDYLNDLSLSDTYDIIYFSSAMYATILGSGRRVRLLKTLSKYLNEGGKLILSVNQLQTERTLTVRLACCIARIVAFASLNPSRYEPGDAYHFWEAAHWFTRDEIQREVASAGLAIDHFISCQAMNFHYLITARNSGSKVN